MRAARAPQRVRGGSWAAAGARPGARAGNYRTFRPTLSYGYAGDGWDAGVRAAVAFNSRNKGTDVIVDGKWLKEFGVRNRPEGRVLWLSVNRRF